MARRDRQALMREASSAVRLRRRLVGTSSAAVLACAAAGAAHAQAPASAAPAGADGQPIQEVVVTAERRAQNVLTTPISVSVVSGAMLQQNHVTDVVSLQSLAPGLSVTSGGPTDNINIRGLGANAVTPAVTTGVAVFHDGLYEAEGTVLGMAFFDIADVEVLKGPQGTIVGQNSTGGSVQINSANPNFNGFGGFAEAQAGNYAEKKADGAINLPISEVLAARIAFNVEHRDSFERDIGATLAYGNSSKQLQPGMVDEHNVRLSLLYKPNEAFQALLKAEVNDLNTGGFPGRPLPFSSFYQYGYNGPSVWNDYETLGKRDLDYNETAESEYEKIGRYGLEMKYKFDDGITLRSMTGYQHKTVDQNIDFDYSAAGATVVGARSQYHNNRPVDSYSQEFNLISPDGGRFTWLLGASYFQRFADVRDQQFTGGTPNAPEIFQTSSVTFPYSFVCPATSGVNCNMASLSHTGTMQRLLGFFGQGDLTLVDTLHLVVGVRESIDTNYNRGYTVMGVTGTPVQLSMPAGTTNSAGYTYIPGSGRYHRSVPTYKIGLNWTPAPGQFLYAFVARGYKEGGVNNAFSDFAPEYVQDYEIGWKSRLFDGHVETQIGGYYMNYDGMQQQVISPVTGVQGVANLGSSTIYGVEASLHARYGGFTWDGGVSYNQSKLGGVSAVANYLLTGNGMPAFAQCPAGSAVANGATGVVNGVTCTNYAGAVASLSGEKNPFSPEWTFNTTLTYTFDLGRDRTLTPRVTYTYQSSQWASIFQNIPTGTSPFTHLPYPNYLLSARSLLDLALAYEWKGWTAELWAKNVANQQYLANIQGANGFYGDPRTFGVRLARTF